MVADTEEIEGDCAGIVVEGIGGDAGLSRVDPVCNTEFLVRTPNDVDGLGVSVVEIGDDTAPVVMDPAVSGRLGMFEEPVKEPEFVADPTLTVPCELEFVAPAATESKVIGLLVTSGATEIKGLRLSEEVREVPLIEAARVLRLLTSFVNPLLAPDSLLSDAESESELSVEVDCA